MSVFVRWNLRSVLSNRDIDIDLMNLMPSHGDYDERTSRWYCSYWMNKEEWLDIHDYSASDVAPKYDDPEQL